MRTPKPLIGLTPKDYLIVIIRENFLLVSKIVESQADAIVLAMSNILLGDRS